MQSTADDTGSLATNEIEVLEGQEVRVRWPNGMTRTLRVTHQLKSKAGIHRAYFGDQGVSFVVGQVLEWEPISTVGADWTELECRVAVEAYAQLQAAAQAGEPVVKAHVYRELSSDALRPRSAKSVEFKFQNISSVLSELGLPWVSGLPPAPNSQELLSRVVLRHLGSAVAAPTSDQEVLRRRALALLSNSEVAQAPVGNQKPESVDRTAKVYERLPSVVSFVLSAAAGHCCS